MGSVLPSCVLVSLTRHKRVGERKKREQPIRLYSVVMNESVSTVDHALKVARKRRLIMDQGIEYLEKNIEYLETSGIESILYEYRKLYPGPADRPLWHLIEDIQQQAMVYTNIIDLLKSGQTASDIKKRFEELDLVLVDTLPNPSKPAILTFALDKISKYRNALVEFIKKHGGEFLNELSVELNLTVSMGVDIGFPPSVTLAVEHTATVVATKKF